MARKFVVLKDFTDLEDKRHVYEAGHFYPRDGAELVEARADALASDNNAQKEPLIIEVLVRQEVPESEGEPKLEDLTVDELKAKLDDQKIEYKAKATKQELIALLGGE